jgi:hypothetical protein
VGADGHRRRLGVVHESAAVVHENQHLGA